jgi:hypothetical protein
MIAFEDETRTELYPHIEAKWMKKGQQKRILTLGYSKRRNVFVTLLWPKRYGFIWNRFEKRSGNSSFISRTFSSTRRGRT